MRPACPAEERAGRYEQAAALLEDAVARNPEFDQVRIMLAATYGQLGRIDDASWEAEEILARDPAFTISADVRIRGFRDRELPARYVEGLRKAGLPEQAAWHGGVTDAGRRRPASRQGAAIESWRRVADDLRGGLAEGGGHWIPEEAPEWLLGEMLVLFAEDPG